jgi:N-acetylglutamate synthase/N-acetylornithine aminotransferase
VKKLFVTAAIAAAIALPSIATAADDSAMMATMVCRPPTTSEKANAMMGSTGLVCRKLDMVKVHAAMDKMMAAGMTHDQMKAAEAEILKDSYLVSHGVYAQ